MNLKHKAIFFCSSLGAAIPISLKTGDVIMDKDQSYIAIASGAHEYLFYVGVTYKENGVDYFNYAEVIPKPSKTKYTDDLRAKLNLIHRPMGEALGENLLNTFYLLIPVRSALKDEEIGKILSKYSAWTHLTEMQNDPICKNPYIAKVIKTAMARYFPESAQV